MFIYLILGLLLGVILTYLLLHKQNENFKKDITSEQFVNKRYLEEVQKLQLQLFETNDKYEKQLTANRDLIRQKSSQATKSGAYVETLSPILTSFPVNILDKDISLKYLGDPIDFISYDFNKPEIIFIEVKSGDSVLSSRQKLVKKMISEGLVRFVEFRINADGTIEVKE